jgi:hypothetical protein
MVMKTHEPDTRARRRLTEFEEIRV